MIERMDRKQTTVSAPEGTYAPGEWPVDVMRTDASGELDLEQIEYNLSLTPAERLKQYFKWMKFATAMWEAGRRCQGVGPRSTQAPE